MAATFCGLINRILILIFTRLRREEGNVFRAFVCMYICMFVLCTNINRHTDNNHLNVAIYVGAVLSIELL